MAERIEVADGPRAAVPSLNVNEAIAALDYHANKAARAGNYPLHDDLHAASNALDDLQSRYDKLKADHDDALDELRALRPQNMETIFSSPFEPPEKREVRHDNLDEEIDDALADQLFEENEQ